VADPIEISRRIRRRVDRAGLNADVVADVTIAVATSGGGPATVHAEQHAPISQGRSQPGPPRCARSEGAPVSDAPGLTPEELEDESGEQLPDREQMSLVNANIAVPVNAAVAANVLSDGSIAYADALQQTPIDQSN
jgi:hypothetical protein